MSTKIPSAEDRAKLREFFLGDTKEHNRKWNELWENGQLLLWDHGQPNPALVDALAERQSWIGEPVDGSTGRRKRALVPGCGKGYDVLLLASVGYDAFGLDISDSALENAEKFAKENWSKYEQTYGKADSKAGPGSYKFLKGNFFNDVWLLDIGAGFDLIYDYTFFCALPPELRPEWARRHSQLVSGDGHLICLEYPLHKDPKTGGPPFGMNSDTYVAHLSRPGEKLPYNKDGYPEIATASSNGNNTFAFERVAHWEPQRTHVVGKGNDKVSIWRRK